LLADARSLLVRAKAYSLCSLCSKTSAKLGRSGPDSRRNPVESSGVALCNGSGSAVLSLSCANTQSNSLRRSTMPRKYDPRVLVLLLSVTALSDAVLLVNLSFPPEPLWRTWTIRL
jgi:hypothetical protein